MKNYLREKFIEKKLNKTPNPNQFNKKQLREWLKWLAKLMTRKNLTTFELADLQPTDLTNKWHFDLIILIVFSLVAVSVYGLNVALSIGVSVSATLLLFNSKRNNIKTEDITIIYFSKQFRRNFLVIGFISGLVSGILLSKEFGYEVGVFLGLIFGIYIGLGLNLTNTKEI